jgi:hypothetical protein
VARVLRELYATKSAGVALSSVYALYPAEIENARILLQHGDHSVFHPSVLPSLDVVQNAAPRLVEAIALQDGNGTVKALGDMGIFALCLAPEPLFGRLEFSVGCVIGPAQIVPLVELAIVAAEPRAYERAGSYIAKAHTRAGSARTARSPYSHRGCRPECRQLGCFFVVGSRGI